MNEQEVEQITKNFTNWVSKEYGENTIVTRVQETYNIEDSYYEIELEDESIHKSPKINSGTWTDLYSKVLKDC